MTGRGRTKIRPPRRVSEASFESMFECLSNSANPQHDLNTCRYALPTFDKSTDRFIWFRSDAQINHFLHSPGLIHASTANMVANVSKGLGNNDAVDFEQIWAVLGSSLLEIHGKNASKLSFEELYRNAYKVVLKKQGDTLYTHVKDFEKKWLVDQVRPEILEELSSNLLVGDAGTSSATTTNERRTAGEKFLHAVRRAWEDHHLCMGMTSDVLMYMVRCHAQSSPHIQASVLTSLGTSLLSR